MHAPNAHRTFLIQGEDLIGRLHVAGLDRLTEASTQRLELLQILGGKEQLAHIQRFEVIVEYYLRQRRIEWARTIGITAVGQQAVYQFGGGAMRGSGLRRVQRLALRHVLNQRAVDGILSGLLNRGIWSGLLPAG